MHITRNIRSGLITLLITLVWTTSAIAQDTLYAPPMAQAPAAPDLSWFSCHTSADCQIVGEECGSPQAVNANFISQYKARFYNLPGTKCTSNLPLSFTQNAAKPTALCLKSRCQVYMPGTFMDPSLYVCQTDEDCTRTENICGMPMAVNTAHVTDYDKMTKQIKSVRPPPCPEPPPGFLESLNGMVSRCITNICTLNR